MENNKVVKALECFIGDTSCKGNCPFNDTSECFECTATPKEFYKSILEIINRQKAGIGELQHKNSELKHKNSSCKAEAIKEFAERLKNRHHTFKTVDDIFVQCIPIDYIDSLVKEMEADYESKGNN